jgi:hypothetical protein
MNSNAGQAAARQVCCAECGKPGNRLCANCAARQVLEQELVKQQIVGRGICPQCGAALIPNTELAGWWTCGAQLSDYPSGPGCDYEVILY